MSRALEPSQKEGVHETASQKQAYHHLSILLTGPPCDDLLEIELLGRSHELPKNTYYQRDGVCIGIPKKILVQAFIEARLRFIKYIQNRSSLSRKELREATAVILLFDPEHLTAANARKRAVAHACLPDTRPNLDLMREKYFVDSLVSSPLHRHSKSPTLWSHKRWLTEQIRRAGIETDLAREFTKVIYPAANQHPRNYYAWNFARFSLDQELQLATQHLGLDWSTRKISWENVDETTVLQIADELITKTLKWCFATKQDVSGWAFVMSLLWKFPSRAPRVLSDTAKITLTYKWRNESVWYFLRNLLDMPRIKNNLKMQTEVLQIWQSLMDDSHDMEGSGDAALQNFKRWRTMVAETESNV